VANSWLTSCLAGAPSINDLANFIYVGQVKVANVAAASMLAFLQRSVVAIATDSG